jgi:hypothetical protein
VELIDPVYLFHCVYGVKNIYDLQMEMLCKNLLYQANGNEIKKLFAIKMSQEQKNIWTSKCPGEMKIQTKNNNNWILTVIKMLNDENIKLCDYTQD